MNDITAFRTIQGHGDELLHVVLSDSQSDNTPTHAPTRYAYISTEEELTPVLRLEGAPIFRFEDSFASGEFDVEISITSDEDPYAKARFSIHIMELCCLSTA